MASDPYRTPADVPEDPPPITFASRQEERVWREFLVALIRGSGDRWHEDVDVADEYLRAWRQRGGNDPPPPNNFGTNDLP